MSKKDVKTPPDIAVETGDKETIALPVEETTKCVKPKREWSLMRN